MAAITVTPQSLPDGSGRWALSFTAASGTMSATFECKEPHTHRLSEWLSLAEGNAYLCQDDGEGSIERAGGSVTFTGASKSGVVARFTVRWADLAAAYAAALEAAQAAGLCFAPEA